MFERYEDIEVKPGDIFINVHYPMGYFLVEEEKFALPEYRKMRYFSFCSSEYMFDGLGNYYSVRDIKDLRKIDENMLWFLMDLYACFARG